MRAEKGSHFFLGLISCVHIVIVKHRQVYTGSKHAAQRRRIRRFNSANHLRGNVLSVAQ